MKIPCAVMTPNPTRLDDFDKYIDEYRIDGVVELVLQTCNPFALETDINRRFITEKKGVPYISIETDFSDNDKGQISTRIGAFVEIIESNK
jgi:benzoyl-CoA reductase/2-hydroxyglutaryl-CoA dehydratase subunit BcrC/BadD/HgdB